MADRHNFKRPKKHFKLSTVDGFITPERFKKPSSFDFDRTVNDSSFDGDAITLDNFNRPSGYYPTVPSVTGAEPQVPLLSDKPRQRIGTDLPTKTEQRRRFRFFRRKSWLQFFKRAALAMLAVIVITAGYLGWKIYKDTAKVFHGGILGIFKTTKLKGEDQGRVTILLAGNSADDPGHNGASLTDSILLISIDTKNNSGFLLSIPRDLWVNYVSDDCSFGNSGKINAVYECGQETKFSQSGYPSGGMGLLEKQVSQDFGVTINYYALIDYTALKDAVNAVGGINFTVKSDDPRGIYDPSIDYTTKKALVKLSNGTHVLNGQQALDLARARGDAYGSYGFPQADFNRTQNQRQMLIALKDKALSAGVLANPAKISSLFDAVGNHVQTDFRTDEIRRLHDIAQKVSDSSIRSIGLNDKNVNLLRSANFSNVSALIPSAGEGNYSQIKAFVKRLTSNDPVVKEGATAVVLNGSNVNGLARQETNALADKGISVQTTATAAKTVSGTIIIDMNTNKTATKAYLEQKYHVTATTDISVYPAAKSYDADFVIILGAAVSHGAGAQ